MEKDIERLSKQSSEHYKAEKELHATINTMNENSRLGIEACNAALRECDQRVGKHQTLLTGDKETGWDGLMKNHATLKNSVEWIKKNMMIAAGVTIIVLAILSNDRIMDVISPSAPPITNTP